MNRAKLVIIGLAFGAAGGAASSQATNAAGGPPVPHHVSPPVQSASGFHRGHAMRAMLTMSAAAVTSDVPASIPLSDGLGQINFPITTANPLAQRYFTQGLGYAYGFNHAAAIASFREAQRLDPACAMCWWGEAFAHGPNINAPMDPATNARAVGVALYANWLARGAQPVERALTAAMVKRYSPDPAADRPALDAAFADAMLAAATAHPEHDDLALLAAESAMNTRPWDYWQADKSPNPRIAEAVRLVEAVMARSPDHPQAAHLYIHLMENGPDPKHAEAAADRLNRPLAPAAGHLVHMPAHIYFRLGRWQDSIRSNIAAARADEAWIAASGDQGLVRYGYYPHNVHFIVTSAQMAGDLPTAIREARKLSRLLDPETSAKIAWIQAVNAAPFFAAAQFASPAQVLAMPAPDVRLPYPTAMRFYARALAQARQRNRAGFERELAALRALRESDAFKPMVAQGVPAPQLLELAEAVARARWNYANGRFAAAADGYRAAAAVEAKIPYMEPPFWYYPVHQSLGAALYRAGKHGEARDAFAAALAQSPRNGWALYGLAAAERSLGQGDKAAAAEAELKSAWLGDPRWLRMDRL
ncbi:tetratricopeptide repeat protein [Sphingomonas sp.]|uniref:tetratricopeptide repeat protein n=1 Tax=Sphingomonas sp. TaxID=28214 RepID=UPI00286DEE96|nr:tetratricopeptide repeat protein [Sphingomonas sp.]